MKNPASQPSLPKWAGENVAKLGTAADYLLAEIFRVPIAEVRAQREVRGIPKYDGGLGSKRAWTPGDLELLGAMTDAAVAAKLGMSVLQVEAKRNHLKISAYAVPVRLRDWLPEEDALLGVKNDSELAALLGVTTATVAARRSALGVPRQRTSGSTKGGHVMRKPEQIWTPEAIARLGKISDAQLASILKIHSSAVRAQREALGLPRRVLIHPFTRSWTVEELALIGTMSDTDVAKKLGISRAPVAVRRKSMGISRYLPEKKQWLWLPEQDALLGVKTDSQVAAQLGISRHIVEKRRNQLGIPRQYAKGKVAPP
jgi:hypothetical protein